MEYIWPILFFLYSYYVNVQRNDVKIAKLYALGSAAWSAIWVMKTRTENLIKFPVSSGRIKILMQRQNINITILSQQLTPARRNCHSWGDVIVAFWTCCVASLHCRLSILPVKYQGSPLWKFWENFPNFKKISKNKKIPRVPPLDILGNFYKFKKNLQ